MSGKGTQSFNPSVRTLTTPALVMIRECPSYYQGTEKIPTTRVPLELRTGGLTIILSLGRLRIAGRESRGTYLLGASVEYDRGCEVLVKVFPRGLSDEAYGHWQRDLIVQTIRLPRAQTPLYVSTEASVRPNGVRRPSANEKEHVQLVQLGGLVHYLRGALPLLGTDPADVAPTAYHINRLFQKGQQRLLQGERRDRR